jgi:hypothetical protein
VKGFRLKPIPKSIALASAVLWFLGAEAYPRLVQEQTNTERFGSPPLWDNATEAGELSEEI